MPGRLWRTAGHVETVQIGPFEGQFAISLIDAADGAIVITSTGEIGGITRRVRARVYLASPALPVALYGSSVVRFEKPPAAAFILQIYGAGVGDRPWIHVAAGREIWFATSYVSINDASAAFSAGPGPLDGPGGAPGLPRPEPVRLLLGRGAELTVDQTHLRVDVQQLRSFGVNVKGVVLQAEALPRLPDVDPAHFQSVAAANTTNAGLNEAAGKYLSDQALARKRDSLYSREEFVQVLSYLRTGAGQPLLQGVIYIAGGVTLADGQRLAITNGALVTESSVHVGLGASLEVTHSAGTRTLPGITVQGNGTLVVAQNARLRVHGLVYGSRIIDVGEGASADIVGAVLGNDAGLSFRTHAATVVIRYDPAVLGTPGLRVPDDAPVVAWVAAWEELQ